MTREMDEGKANEEQFNGVEPEMRGERERSTRNLIQK